VSNILDQVDKLIKSYDREHKREPVINIVRDKSFDKIIVSNIEDFINVSIIKIGSTIIIQGHFINGNTVFTMDYFKTDHVYISYKKKILSIRSYISNLEKHFVCVNNNWREVKNRIDNSEE
jgi:hypothetical protein